LYNQENFEFLDQPGSEALDELRGFFHAFTVSNTQIERPVDTHEEKVIFYTFSGTRINRTISFLLTTGGLKNYLEDQKTSSIELDVTYDEFLDKWEKLISQNIDVDFHLTQLLEEKPAILEFSKWGYLLPLKYQIQLLKQKYFDFQVLDSLSSIKFIANI
jgi:ATP-dependent Lhr-like helicase